jgi:hypothetical protein
MDLNVKNISKFGFILPYRISNISTFGILLFVEPENGTYILNHSELALNLLLEQFKNPINLKKVITTFIEPLQELENLILQLRKLNSIDDSVGENLNRIGGLIGQDRQGLNDIDFRQAIYIKILLNHSFGQPEILIMAIKFLTKCQRNFYCEPFSATVYIDFNTNIIPPVNLQQVIKNIALAGVKIILQIGEDLNYNFVFSPEIDNRPFGLGFSEMDIGGNIIFEGGKIMDLII